MDADPNQIAEGTTAGRGGKRRAVPRGVIVLGLLLYVGAFVSAVVAAAPAGALANLPRWVYLLYALVLAILATGLLRRRRWAWFAMLAFVATNAYYLLLGTAQRGQNTIVALTILAIVAAYLFWPGVRSAYLERDT